MQALASRPLQELLLLAVFPQKACYISYPLLGNVWPQKVLTWRNKCLLSPIISVDPEFTSNFMRWFWFRPLLWLQFKTLDSTEVTCGCNRTGVICKGGHKPGNGTLREASVLSDTSLSPERLDCTQPSSRLPRDERYKRVTCNPHCCVWSSLGCPSDVLCHTLLVTQISPGSSVGHQSTGIHQNVCVNTRRWGSSRGSLRRLAAILIHFFQGSVQTSPD